MVANIGRITTVCGNEIHIHSISVIQTNTASSKKYYQHRHPGFELHYAIKGQCTAYCNQLTYPLPAATLLLIPPGFYHDVIHADHETQRICISFTMQMCEKSDTAESFYKSYSKYIPVTVRLQSSVPEQILSRILQIMNQSNDIYKIEKLLYQCISLLLELIPHIPDLPDNDPISTGEDRHEDINFQIDSFLGTHFMENNAKTNMANELYISPRQLQRIIQKNYGMSYREKLAETRVQIATDLLRNTGMQIHKIAEILGYSCSANFSAFIKRETGKTPSQIRKEE